MNLLSSALSLALAGTAWQTPVQGCMNSWVSNGTWSVRVTNVQSLSDRVDLALTWRNDTKKTRQPAGNHTLIGVHGLYVTYNGPYGSNDSDTLGMWDTANSDHANRKGLGNDLLLHSFAPGATYKTVLHFYYPDTYSAKAGHNVVVPRKQEPIKFTADTVISPDQKCSTGCQSPIVVKLNCGT